MERGDVVGARRLDPAPAPAGGWAAVLEHPAIPFISYPYEWTFGMLKDAALLQLSLLEAALPEGMILKDASSFNVQWSGGRPVFIDVGSFTRHTPGHPWSGYQQFCRLFLYPLLLQAHKDLPFQRWLRGGLDGITAGECAAVFSLADVFKPGVFLDVLTQSWLESKFSRGGGNVRGQLQDAAFGTELILKNLARLKKLVTKLEPRRGATVWSDYARQRNYSEEDYQRKMDFVGKAAARRRRRLVWDVGCNTGDFSRIAAAHADLVLAMDGDAGALDALHRSLKPGDNILPLLVNVADPSPGLGWRGRERKTLEERGRPDLVLCLAVIHHLVLSANIPLPDLVAWLASLKSDLVIEFVTKEDGMVKRLLENKDDIYADYDPALFERLLRESFNVRGVLPVSDGRRVLYDCEIKP